MDKQKEKMFNEISKSTKDKADNYTLKCRHDGIERTNSLKKLVEVALEDFMSRNPL